ncbi:MAG: general secretion pathway protein GspK [Sedimentisphaerales bacterium]|nr:general secretion pathway protein GspK [Sedimentisphaerales bacterium]
MTAKRDKQAGTVLAGVMWMLVVMMAILAVGAQNSRLDSRISLSSVEKIRCRWMARAGAETALAYLKEDLRETDSLLDEWVLDTTELEDVVLYGGTYTVTITDECSKLNINTASAVQLLALDTETMNETITDSIIDWRDRNEEAETNGAESGYYLNLPIGYQCRNANFRTPRELLRVRGVTEDLFYGENNRTLGKGGWSQYLTCFSATNNVDASGNQRINVNSASENDMVSQLSITQAQARWITQNRRFRSLADLMGTSSSSTGTPGGTGTSTGGSNSSGTQTPARTSSALEPFMPVAGVYSEHDQQMIDYSLMNVTPALLVADAGSGGRSSGGRQAPSQGGRRGGQGGQTGGRGGRGGEGGGMGGRPGGGQGGGQGQGGMGGRPGGGPGGGMGQGGMGGRPGGGQGGGMGRPGQGGGMQGGARGGVTSPAGGQTEVQAQALDWATFSRILDQVTISNNTTITGQINVNTVSLEVLRAFLGGNDDLAGKIINYRDSMGGELTSVGDLINVDGMTQDILRQYIDLFCVRSSVYMIRATSTSSVSGVSYTIEMVINRDREGREILYQVEGVGI